MRSEVEPNYQIFLFDRLPIEKLPISLSSISCSLPEACVLGERLSSPLSNRQEVGLVDSYSTANYSSVPPLSSLSHPNDSSPTRHSSLSSLNGGWSIDTEVPDGSYTLWGCCICL